MGDMIDRDAVLALLAVGKVKTTYRGKFEPSHKSPQSAAVMEERKRLARILAALEAPDDGVVAELVEALDNLLEAVSAKDQHGDGALTITGPTANLKWLIEAEDDARAILAKLEPRA
ncbi:MAG: hypothetical protein RSE12_17210 [Fuscovulum sp.]|nr:MAG: hypothetical protein RSE12_17210 [Fuscovulum sp.]